jgi:GGDEF domain-containing protein
LAGRSGGGRDFRWEGVRIPMSMAYGAYCLTPREDAQLALAAADRAMYRQKREAPPRA